MKNKKKNNNKKKQKQQKHKYDQNIKIITDKRSYNKWQLAAFITNMTH